MEGQFEWPTKTNENDLPLINIVDGNLFFQNKL